MCTEIAKFNLLETFICICEFILYKYYKWYEVYKSNITKFIIIILYI